MDIIIIITLVRLLVPFIILRFPLLGIALSILADLYDWKFYPVTNAEELAEYQSWDKALDFYYQLFILYIALKIKDMMSKSIAFAMFIYRTIGVVLFSLTDMRVFLVIFPNFFENFVILYLIYRFITKDDILFKSKKIFFIVLPVIIIPKTIHEYFMHYLTKQPWEVFDVGAYLNTTGVVQEYINYLSYGTLFYILPIGILPFILKKLASSSSKEY